MKVRTSGEASGKEMPFLGIFSLASIRDHEDNILHSHVLIFLAQKRKIWKSPSGFSHSLCVSSVPVPGPILPGTGKAVTCWVPQSDLQGRDRDQPAKLERVQIRGAMGRPGIGGLQRK